MCRERIKIPGRWQLQRCDATCSASWQDDDTQVVLVGSSAAGRNSQAALGKVGVEVGGLCLDAVARWTNREVWDERDVELHVREVGNAMGRGQEHRRRDEAAAADLAVDGTDRSTSTSSAPTLPKLVPVGTPPVMKVGPAGVGAVVSLPPQANRMATSPRGTPPRAHLQHSAGIMATS